MRAKTITTLNHPSELQALSVWRFGRTRGLGRLHLPESFRHEERERFERELNRHYYACGCDTGAKGVVLATLVALVSGVWRWMRGQTTVPHAALLLCAAALGGGLLGKFVGLAIASRKLELLKREMMVVWKVEPPPSDARIILGD